MDGDSTAKTMDKGANSALGAQDMGDAIHEQGHEAVGIFFYLLLTSERLGKIKLVMGMNDCY